MATNEVNKSSRKRKSDADLIFEVNEADFSPATSPELPENNTCNNSGTQSDADNDLSSQTDNSNLDAVVYSETAHVNKPDASKVIILTEESEISEEAVAVEVKTEVQPSEDDNKEAGKSASDKLLFSLKFYDKDFADEYKSKVVSAIMGVFSIDVKEQVDDDNLEVKFWEEKGSCDMDIVDDESNDSCCITDGITDEIQTNIDDLFVVDTTPNSQPQLGAQPKFLPRLKYDAIDVDINKGEGKSSARESLRQNICFNCDGQHSLKDCKEPRDQRRIQIARNNYKTAFKSVRYHLDEEQKYGHITPGKISDKLRTALNLSRHEIPNHVYHMRRVGYSPGWLEMAKIKSSDMKMFDFEGYSISDPVLETIDPDKVIEYPGFNIPMEKGCKDKYRERGCPAYNKAHSKVAMLRHIKQNMLFVRPKDAPEKQSRETERNSRVQDFPPPGCESDSPEDAVKESRSREASPTLTDLELKKKQILDLLNESRGISSPNTPSSQDDANRSDVEPLASSIKCSTYGTPILKNCSPYETLPNSEKFSKDISQVINFENLPNSTGKYEQMSQVINKVRRVIRYTNEEKKS